MCAANSCSDLRFLPCPLQQEDEDGPSMQTLAALLIVRLQHRGVKLYILPHAVLNVQTYGQCTAVHGQSSNGCLHDFKPGFDVQPDATILVRSGGVMGRTEPPKGSQPVPLYYSNPDIVYANEFPAPRFGQGCFAAALDAVYAAVRLQHSVASFMNY